MKPAPFSYIKPNTIEEAIEAIEKYGDAGRIIAGGQSLVPMMNLRLVQYDYLIDISGLMDLQNISSNNSILSIGSMVTHTNIKKSDQVLSFCPLMIEAYGCVAHRPIRNRGTLGGNLSHAYPASEMPAVALAVDAELVAMSKRGERVIKAADFFVSVMETSLESDELLTEIRLPSWPEGQGWSFLELSPRKGDFAFVGVAITLMVKDGICEKVRIAHCAVEDRARRVPEAEDIILGQKPTEDIFRQASIKASQVIDPESDFHADGPYRRDLMNTLTFRALCKALGRCS